MLLNTQYFQEEIKGEIFKNLKPKGKHNITKPLGYSKSSSKRKAYSDKHIKEEKRTQINNPLLYLKELGKEQNKPKVSRRKEIKIRTEKISQRTNYF
jgi:hypothetical protein